MTRNRELDLDDLRECQHEPEVPVTYDGIEIDYWLCRCGRKVVNKPTRKKKTAK